MKNLFFLSYTMILFLFQSDSSKTQPENSDKHPASSILFINNLTSNSTINSISVYYPSLGVTDNFTINVAPNGSYRLDLGNTSENVIFSLHLSNSFSGSVQIHEIDPYYCPHLFCNQYTNDNTPGGMFYMYTPRWLYLTNYNYCFC